MSNRLVYWMFSIYCLYRTINEISVLKGVSYILLVFFHHYMRVRIYSNRCLCLFSGVLFPLVFLSCRCTQKTLFFASSEAFLMLFGLDYVNSRLSNFSGPCYAVKKATLQHDFKNEGKL